MVALFELLMGLAYAHYAYRFGRTAARRYAHRAHRPINRVWLIIWSALWPIWMTMWFMFRIATGQPIPSLLREPSKAERRKAELARLKEERSLAIKDWQRRASYWYELGQKAEAEDDQALKWAVAENLNFLLETKPEGAQVSGLTAPETSRETVDETPATDWEKVSESIRSERKAVGNVLGLPPARLAEIEKAQRDVTSPSYSPPTLPPTAHASGAVSFCNTCARYRKSDQMTMKGVCNECAVEQGL